MTAVASINVRAALRARTAAVHQRLETIPVMQRLLQGTLTLDNYIQVLMAYRSFHAAAAHNLELGYRQLRAAGLAIVDKAPLVTLDADLACLGQTSQDIAGNVAVPVATKAQSVG